MYLYWKTQFWLILSELQTEKMFSEKNKKMRGRKERKNLACINSHALNDTQCNHNGTSLATVHNYILFQIETMHFHFIIKMGPSKYDPWNTRKNCPCRGIVEQGGSKEMKVLFF